ncbi:MAG: BREX system ATP-binding protein BrxD [Planctomycetaceae bacterium]
MTPVSRTITTVRRNEILDALRRGTVPGNRLDSFAVGLSHLEPTLNEELERTSSSGSQFKAVRGEYGCGKTFFARWIAEKARQFRFVTAEVQISETETPLHRLETVYRRIAECMLTCSGEPGGFRNSIDGWFYVLEQDVLAEGDVDPEDEDLLMQRTNDLLEKRLSRITATAPTFSMALRGYRRFQAEGNTAFADAIMNWLAGQPNVAAAAKREAGIRGEIDHMGALTFLQGVLALLKDSGQAGLLLVLDELETIQRVRSDIRDKSLNALRQILDEIDRGRFPGLYLVVTGTQSFFEGPQGVQRLPPLAQRLHVHFDTDTRFDNPRAVQIRLTPFDQERLFLVGQRIRDIFATHCRNADRINRLCGDDYVRRFATAVCGQLGGKVGMAPRVFLKKLVDEVLDRIDLYPDFLPERDHEVKISDSELTDLERASRGANDVNNIELDL